MSDPEKLLEAQHDEKKQELDRRQREELKKTEAQRIEALRKQRDRPDRRTEDLQAPAIPPHWQKYREQLLELARRGVLLKWQRHFVAITEARQAQTALRTWARAESEAGRLPPAQELHRFRRQGGLAALETYVETGMRRDLQRRHTNPLFPHQEPQVSDRVFPKDWNIDRLEEGYREWSRRCLGALHRTPDISAERRAQIWAKTSRWLEKQEQAGHSLGGEAAYEAHPRIDDYRSIIDGEVLREAQHALGWTDAHVDHLARQLDNYIDFELFDKTREIQAALKDLGWQQYEPALRDWAQKILNLDLAPPSSAAAETQALNQHLQENVSRGTLPDWPALYDAKALRYVLAHLTHEALQHRHAIELHQHTAAQKLEQRAWERIREAKQRRKDEKQRGKDRDGGRERDD